MLISILADLAYPESTLKGLVFLIDDSTSATTALM
jgi:hypothetical protein